MIRPNHIEPSKKAKTSLLGKVDKKIQESKLNIEKLLANDKLARNNEPTFAQTLSEIDSTVRGWANSFRFVDNRLAFSQLDRQIHQKLSGYRTWLSNLPMASEPQRHRILGVFQTHDVEHKPLEAFLIKRAKRSPQPILQLKRRTDLNRGAKLRNGSHSPSSG